ncbi:MAG: helix-turn-helix domain-containing protein, partial [Lachnospiraceae bacterium]|nr:helix-turn-helix domain-containing protein [Lachnospiraceae bacterium]
MGTSEIIRALRAETGLSRKLFSEKYGIPLRTIEDWESGRRKPPEYISRLLNYRVKMEISQNNINANHKISIINDAEDHKIVMIHDLRF